MSFTSGEFNQPKATFFLVTMIIGAILFMIIFVMGGCGYMAFATHDQFCKGDISNTIKEMMLQLLSIALALMGGGAAGIAHERSRINKEIVKREIVETRAIQTMKDNQKEKEASDAEKP
jgi:hypothetical protein